MMPVRTPLRSTISTTPRGLPVSSSTVCQVPTGVAVAWACSGGGQGGEHRGEQGGGGRGESGDEQAREQAREQAEDGTAHGESLEVEG